MLLLCVITYIAYVDSVSIMMLIWCPWLGSTFEQLRASCLTAPSHYLNQCRRMGYCNWKITIGWSQSPTTFIVSREYGFRIVVEIYQPLLPVFCFTLRSALPIIPETFRGSLIQYDVELIGSCISERMVIKMTNCALSQTVSISQRNTLILQLHLGCRHEISTH